MSTATGGRDESRPLARDADLVKLPRCIRCQLSYMPSKSTSALKLTYCSFLCELGDLGFSMTGLEHMQRAPKRPAALLDAEAEPEPIAVE
ncbi:MAG: hypothetical protein ACR2HN_02150 [Tepidiformaceae bacterium]